MELTRNDISSTTNFARDVAGQQQVVLCDTPSPLYSSCDAARITIVIKGLLNGGIFYKFRLIAVNIAGESDPSAVSEIAVTSSGKFYLYIFI